MPARDPVFVDRSMSQYYILRIHIIYYPKKKTAKAKRSQTTKQLILPELTYVNMENTKRLFPFLCLFHLVNGWSCASQTRAKFLSSSATAFLLSSSVVTGNPEECDASVFDRMISRGQKENPRYVDLELQMKYGEDKGKTVCRCW